MLIMKDYAKFAYINNENMNSQAKMSYSTIKNRISNF